MEFEFDPLKSISNKAKHGIDFQLTIRKIGEDMVFSIC